MINLYSGTPGSGKSLYAAYDVIRWLERGKDVIANFPIDMDYFKSRKKIGNFVYLNNFALTVSYLKDYAKHHHKLGKESQTLIVVDECGVLFNSRTWDRADRMEWITFFSQHRKLGYDVLLISQFDRMIDRQIRSFIETEYKFRNLRNYKSFGFIMSLLSGGCFVRVQYWYGQRIKLSSQIFRLHRKKAKIYDTMLLFE